MADTSKKEQVIFWLETLVDLIRKDRVHVDQINGLTADEVIALAETEADKAVEGAQELKDGE